MKHTHFEKHPTLNLHQDIIARHRLYGKNERSKGRDPVIRVVCAGGCNQVHRVRASRIKKGQFFVCNDNATRDKCQGSIPRAQAGRVRVLTPQQAGKFAGVTFEDKGRRAALKASLADMADGAVSLLTRLGFRKD